MKPRDNNARFKLPKLYKRLLLVAMVVGPMWWLVFTEDGQRRTDTVLLTLFGKETLYLNLKALDDRFSEQEMRQLYPDIEWQCENKASAWGDRICAAGIGNFNDIPAEYATLFFAQTSLNAVKVVYNRSYHEILGRDLNHQLGKPLPPLGSAEVPAAAALMRWRADGGFVITKKQLNKEDEAALLWLSPKQMARGIGPGE